MIFEFVYCSWITTLIKSIYYNDLKLCIFFCSDLVISENSSFLCNAKNGRAISLKSRFGTSGFSNIQVRLVR